MLMPAAVLIFLVLGALCVDFGGAFLAQRELENAAAAAANDAATQAIDLPHLYASGEVRLSGDVARRVAERSVAAKGLGRLDAYVEDVQITGNGTRVLVVVGGRSRYIFAKAVPGGRDHIDLTTSSEAEATEIGD
jgi:Flp pilus assembly protein TadG